jgi:PTH1 family peptidyl-tRNA hydrolase
MPRSKLLSLKKAKRDWKKAWKKAKNPPKKQKKAARNNLDLLVIGLGNPGEKYTHTRHNVGFDTVELLAGKFNLFFKSKRFPAPYAFTETSLPEGRLVLVKPLTFMNESGRILSHVLRRFGMKPENMLVIVDNLDLEPGMCRLKTSGSSAGHNGLRSIARHLGDRPYARLFIGIGHPGPRGDVIKYVLNRPAKKEWPVYLETFGKAADAVLDIMKDGPERVKNGLNRKKSH